MHLGIIGYGNIGQTLVELLAGDPVQRLTLLVRETGRDNAERTLRAIPASERFDVVTSLHALLDAEPELVAECAGQSAVSEFVPTLLERGISTLIASIGALADNALASRLGKAAQDGGAKLILPSGAIGGIDLLAALAPAGDLLVTYRGTKPPLAWKGTPAEATQDLDGLHEPVVFFDGSARDAALTYPKNANVAATLALAGAGFEATRVQLMADPNAKGNTHSYEVSSPICRYAVEIENTASDGNAKTSVSTVYSMLREINRIRQPLVI